MFFPGRIQAATGACLITSVLLLACSDSTKSPSASASLLIVDVRIVDGSGSPPFTGSVRVIDGVITGVGDIERSGNEELYHGRGLVLAPGFIDTHSHADSDVFDHPEALAALSQGITTTVVGQDGFSPYPLADFIARFETAGSAINFASYVGHNTLRDELLGADSERPATDGEVEAMNKLLRRELRAGAIGLSSGLEYEPGMYAESGEVLALARLTADEGGRYISHIRSEDRQLDKAVDEIIDIGRQTGMPVQISHIKLAMKSLWGQAPQLLERLDAARREGIDITADVYPYEYWQSTMMVLLPGRDPSDRAEVTFALEQLAPPEGIWFTRFEPNPDYVGLTLSEIAGQREVDAVTAFMQLGTEAQAMATDVGRSVESIIGTSMDAADVSALIAWEHSNICTDGGLVDRHPRASGSFTRILGRYTREQGLLELPDAVRKMTGLAADHMGMTDRGYLRIGQAADLVLFDPDSITDRATPEHPAALSEGVAAVWVGGEMVFGNGRAGGTLPGKFLKP